MMSDDEPYDCLQQEHHDETMYSGEDMIEMELIVIHVLGFL